MEILAIEYKRAFESVDSERNTRRSNCAKWCVYIYTYIYIYIYIFIYLFFFQKAWKLDMRLELIHRLFGFQENVGKKRNHTIKTSPE
jgi:ABC-type phosphate transport system permease subunit